MPPNYAQEFTPELTQGYLATLLNPIDQEGRVEEGRARAEAADRGLSGQLQGSSMVNAVRADTAKRRSDTVSRFNFDVAGLRREERLYGERTAGDRAFTSTEAEKTRAFQEKLANMGYNFERGEREAGQGFEKVQNQQGLVTGLVGGIAAGAVGGYAGRR